MSELQSLAWQKSDAQMQRRINKLPGDIQALHRKLAADGGLRSGSMLKQVLGLCQEALRDQGSTLVTEYKWAVSQALFAPQSWGERLVSDASQSIEPLYEACIRHVQAAVALAGVERVESRLLDELAGTKGEVTADIALALRSSIVERKRGLVRLLPALLSRLASKFLSGGHP